ncbi:site-specific DNA-methyltransferase [Adhaeribacter rhizoryzae]|uniref:site-specific DNA-methyltransferase (adenine-specific) n=1 Tax=Adhaeribacter rhizoryzae TaxID=2607907 RepID=A0A5M6D4C3_9BACT|nr:site-specific DNA-methyltransferase [Adhaeribacter rhizoryzae]KAA5542331.1 site-specific DNA-methyltransferase [Adhaeribacter rhizoryzae]
MAHERIKPEFLFDEEKIKQLKQIAPECFEDGKINFETLRQNLGDWLDDEVSDIEHFGLIWPGKKDARRLASLPPEGTLEPVYGEGLKADGTPDMDGVNDSKNIFIEGENLEVLKILQKSYANKIKMIYIDPPYNTGNDFVYDDDFTEPLQEYLRRTGQIDEEGKPLTTNKKSDGRFHSKWLSMMYPRIRLARNLLKEDGVIFVSIDDNELANLKLIMNEVFGEENFLGVFVINSSPSAIDYGHMGKMHEYALFYGKNAEETVTYQLPEEEKIFKYSDEIGPFNIYPLYNGNVVFNPKTRPNLHYPFYLNPSKELDNGFFEIDTEKHDKWIEVWPVISEKDGISRVWRWGKPKSKENLNKEIVGYVTNSGEYRIVQKYRHSGKVIRSLQLDTDISSRRGTSDLEKIFGSKVFTFPKAIELLKRFVQVGSGENDIVLDFFAGSGSLAQAVLELNLGNNVQRSFICVQMHEKCDKSSIAENKNYDRISQITRDRICKVINKIKSNSGVKVFEYKGSNYKKWYNFKGENISQLENTLNLFNNSPLRDDWNKNRLVTELMLIEGFPLDAAQSIKKIGSNEIVKVVSEMVPNSLLICLDEKIEEGLIAELELDRATTFICLDSAISNQNKLRLSDRGLIKTI